MSSERYDEQYVEIDGIRVLTYLVPDYDSVPETGEYHNGTPSKWLRGQPMVDRKHGWIIGDDIEYPSPSFDGDEWAEAYGLRWCFIDTYWETQVNPGDAPEGTEWFVWYRHAGSIEEMQWNGDTYETDPCADTMELTEMVLIEKPADMYVLHFSTALQQLARHINAIAADYEQEHTPEGYRILWQDLPLMGWHEHRYFSADAWQVTEDPHERARQLASDYVRRENFGQTWGYYGVCAKWTGPDGELVEDSVWMVDVDFGDSDSDYVRSIREDVASEVAHEAKAILEYHAEIEAEARREAEAQARRVFYEGTGL